MPSLSAVRAKIHADNEGNYIALMPYSKRFYGKEQNIAVAWYSAVILALEKAIANRELIIETDSELVYKQLNDKWKIKKFELLKKIMEIDELAARKKIKLRVVLINANENRARIVLRKHLEKVKRTQNAKL